MIERNGYKKWGPCLKEAPNLKTDFGKIVLNAWISFFFEYPDLMELVGIIAEQENPNADPEVIKEMRALKSGTLVTKSNKRGPLTGMKVVFTGASSYFKGEAMERFLEKNGAITSHTVTTNTELLITGSRPAYSKMTKAKNNKIRIITEEDFMKEFKDQLVGLP
jgi:NAD-dependent DNA ligase